MAPRRKRSRVGADPLAPYRRIRKPVPPPGRVIPDRRRAVQEREARRELREGRA